MIRILYSIPVLYVAALLSGARVIWDLVDGSWYYPQMMFESGFLSVVFLIVTLAVTPTLIAINRIGRGAKFGGWLLRRRKHFGLISLIFAAVHLLHYIRYVNDFSYIWAEAFDLELLAGWLAFVVFAILGATSNRASIRKLGGSWKKLHRLIYPAAGLSFLHWYLFDLFAERVVFWLTIIVAVKLIHVGLLRISNKFRRRKLV
ncbi:MAG: ferric reductase-like transmembrane domain-containing protein [Litoreibacter sp.]